MDNYKDYGKFVFTKDKAKEYFSKELFEKYLLYKNFKIELTIDEFDQIALAIKKWCENYHVKYYKHCFNSFNGKISGKEIAFLEISNKTITSFTYRDLLKDELDGSSFPNGGLRNTHEAKGYLFYDRTVDVFIYNKILHIPSLFYSINMEALDDRIPLIKSNKLICDVLLKLLKKIGISDVNRINKYLGVEQEYFLIEKKHYLLRDDLLLLGRTIFGNYELIKSVSKNHYLDSLKCKLLDFNNQVSNELWKLNIPCKTRHSEVGLKQEEIVCIFEDELKTSFDNHLVLEIMDDVANRYHLKCLFQEKPFKGLCGSGKHNNFSFMTDKGTNLFTTSNNVDDSLIFLSILSCMIKGLNQFSDLLQLSISSRGNDLRLGELEAPKSLISLYLGEEVEDLINALFEDKNYLSCNRDNLKNNERNRTSPFAFCGNRFEFRSLGASQPLEFVNTIINLILTNEIEDFISKIDHNHNIKEIIKDNIINNKNVIFNGNNYSLMWKNLASKRGLRELNNAYNIIKILDNEKNMKLLRRVLSEEEIMARKNIFKNKYLDEVILEAKVSIKMVKTLFFPSFIHYYSNYLSNKYTISNIFEYKHIKNYNDEYIDMINSLIELTKELEAMITNIKIEDDNIDELLKLINSIRNNVDKLESITSKKYYPIPTYIDILVHNL